MDEFPGPIATSVSMPSAAVTVTHHHGAAIGSEPTAVVLRESNVTPDTLTRIQVWPYGKPASSVLLLWQRQPAAEGVSVLLSDAADTLFVGAGTFAAAVRLGTGEVVGPHDVFLFWSFQPCGNFVLELGELSCFLRSSTGEVLGEVPVDPPFELFQTSEGVRFESMVMGTHWLYFPR